ncbi:hypothetical protein PMAYCL1PPCAC_31212, partial [Pristionchus mayeri]
GDEGVVWRGCQARHLNRLFQSLNMRIVTVDVDVVEAICTRVEHSGSQTERCRGEASDRLAPICESFRRMHTASCL